MINQKEIDTKQKNLTIFYTNIGSYFMLQYTEYQLLRTF